jgi:uncharacterized protein DUF4019
MKSKQGDRVWGIGCRVSGVGTKRLSFPETRHPIPDTRHLFPAFTAACCLLLFVVACNSSARQQRGIPPQAEERINRITEEIDAGDYEKIYREAADEWRSTTTLEQSSAIFSTLKTRLGQFKGRTYQTAREEQSTSSHLPGHSLIVRYYTTFERGEGTETFTLVERDGQWLLAKYFVNSDALK